MKDFPDDGSIVGADFVTSPAPFISADSCPHTSGDDESDSEDKDDGTDDKDDDNDNMGVCGDGVENEDNSCELDKVILLSVKRLAIAVR